MEPALLVVEAVPSPSLLGRLLAWVGLGPTLRLTPEQRTLQRIIITERNSSGSSCPRTRRRESIAQMMERMKVRQ